MGAISTLITCLERVVAVLVCFGLLAGCAAGQRAGRCGGVDGEWATWSGFLQTEGKMRVIRLASADVPPFVTQFNEAYDTTFRADDVYFAYKPNDRTWLITFVTGPCVDMSARIPKGEATKLMGVPESPI